jgi:hypothetical protein
VGTAENRPCGKTIVLRSARSGSSGGIAGGVWRAGTNSNLIRGGPIVFPGGPGR